MTGIIPVVHIIWYIHERVRVENKYVRGRAICLYDACWYLICPTSVREQHETRLYVAIVGGRPPFLCALPGMPSTFFRLRPLGVQLIFHPAHCHRNLRMPYIWYHQYHQIHSSSRANITVYIGSSLLPSYSYNVPGIVWWRTTLTFDVYTYRLFGWIKVLLRMIPPPRAEFPNLISPRRHGAHLVEIFAYVYTYSSCTEDRTRRSRRASMWCWQFERLHPLPPPLPFIEKTDLEIRKGCLNPFNGVTLLLKNTP